MRSLSAIVLGLWAASLLLCSAGHMGLVPSACCEHACPPAPCGGEPCEHSGGHDGDSPCGEQDGDSPCSVCEFLRTGGASTMSPLGVQSPQRESSAGSGGDPVSPPISRHRELDPDGRVLLVAGAEGHLRTGLYTRLAPRSLPVRGPNFYSS